MLHINYFEKNCDQDEFNYNIHFISDTFLRNGDVNSLKVMGIAAGMALGVY